MPGAFTNALRKMGEQKGGFTDGVSISKLKASSVVQ